jgi:NAD(P)-dependent dehydrogenase (short-subunit alcohol dehydrogenase family)
VEEQRVIVVTGTSSCFGRRTVERFAGAGWRVFATMRESTARHAEDAASLVRLGARVVELDVTGQGSVDRAAVEILAEVEGVDVLVNNAGTGYVGPTEAFTIDGVRAQFELNVFGALRANALARAWPILPKPIICVAHKRVRLALGRRRRRPRCRS